MEDDSKFESLSERQRLYLRLVFDLCSSHEIAFRTESSSSAVDKQLNLACRKLDASSRIDAARRFHEYEARVQSLDPGGKINSPSRPSLWPLPWLLPSKAAPVNTLTRQQVVAWAMILAIVAPTSITVAAMFIVAITLLLGVHL